MSKLKISEVDITIRKTIPIEGLNNTEPMRRAYLSALVCVLLFSQKSGTLKMLLCVSASVFLFSSCDKESPFYPDSHRLSGELLPKTASLPSSHPLAEFERSTFFFRIHLRPLGRRRMIGRANKSSFVARGCVLPSSGAFLGNILARHSFTLVIHNVERD